MKKELISARAQQELSQQTQLTDLAEERRLQLQRELNALELVKQQHEDEVLLASAHALVVAEVGFWTD